MCYFTTIIYYLQPLQKQWKKYAKMTTPITNNVEILSLFCNINLCYTALSIGIKYKYRVEMAQKLELSSYLVQCNSDLLTC